MSKNDFVTESNLIDGSSFMDYEQIPCMNDRGSLSNALTDLSSNNRIY